jgi:hypothetical protein
MDEIFPLLGGLVLGLAASPFRPAQRWIIIGMLTPIIALTASWISGEFAQDWRFVLLDAGEVALAAVAARTVVAWRRHSDRIA